MLTVGLIGAGAHSLGNHAPALQRFAENHKGVAVSVCDIDSGRANGACQTFGFANAYTDIQKLIHTERPDALLVVLPVPLIVPTARALLPAGIPMMIEKPLGNSIEDATALADAVAKANGQVIVSLNRRFDPGLNRALEWIKQHGPVRSLLSVMLRHHRTEPEFIWGTGIHLIDAMFYAVGPLTIVPGSIVRPAGNVAWVSAQFTGSDGLHARADIYPTAGRNEERHRFIGDDFCVDVWTNMCHPWRIEAYHNGEPAMEEQADENEPFFVSCGAYGEACAFLTAVWKNQGLPGPSVHDALLSSEIASALRETP